MPVADGRVATNATVSCSPRRVHTTVGDGNQLIFGGQREGGPLGLVGAGQRLVQRWLDMH